jgi:hypothetical protein
MLFWVMAMNELPYRGYLTYQLDDKAHRNKRRQSDWAVLLNRKSLVIISGKKTLLEIIFRLI